MIDIAQLDRFTVFFPSTQIMIPLMCDDWRGNLQYAMFGPFFGSQITHKYKQMKWVSGVEINIRTTLTSKYGNES